MKVLITGAGGFVGKHLVRAMLDHSEDELIALDRNLDALEDDPRIRKCEGNLTDRSTIEQLFRNGIDKIFHLAAVPGGSAEQDPLLSRQVNVDATLDLLDIAAAHGTCPRFVFASTIAVFGDPLPVEGVDDSTALCPRLIYGMHKSMSEVAIATMTRRGAIDGISVRLPGIVARPRAPSGLKSAFMSDVFHALNEGVPFTLPVSPKAHLWLMSVRQCANNLRHALTVDTSSLPEHRAMTLPALRMSLGDLVDAIAAETDNDISLIDYAPDEALEASFGSQPPLSTPAADHAGMMHDGTLEGLVRNSLTVVRQD